MSFDNIFSAANISASGLSAERLRMEVVANNIANAYTTRAADGSPYRRQDVVFAEVLNHRLSGGRLIPELGGVEVAGRESDPTPLPWVHNPGHPDANEEGYVQMPNVSIPIEMVNMITANRAYEANLKVLRAFRRQAEQALSLLRS